MGFVSNSSSSNFLIACKGNYTDFKKQLVSKFIIKDYPIENLGENIANILINNTKFIIKNKSDLKNYFKQQYAIDIDNAQDDEDIIKEYTDYLENGYTIYLGSNSDDEEAVESLLCNSEINFENSNIIIKSNGGY